MNIHPKQALGVFVSFAALLVLLLVALTPASRAADPPAGKPTVVLVHGAFAESSSWNGVIGVLQSEGYPVIAAANPLRGLKSDSAYVASLLGSITGPIILVGHSYGGEVITNAAYGNPNVGGLVYVAGLAPDVGETGSGLSSRSPGSTLNDALAPPVPLPDGSRDLYIRQDLFHQQFAADVPESMAQLMAVTQRPIAEAALGEPSGPPAWKTIPSWFVYGGADKIIPPAVHAFMAQRAGARETVAIPGASHVVMISHPDAVAAMITEAAGR